MLTQDDFPQKTSEPALRALKAAGIGSLEELSHYTIQEILKLHGMGPASIPRMKAALKAQGLDFRDS